MLHIHNGDSSANILKESGLLGEHVAWREALIAGPTPRGLSNDEWLRVRAAHLAEAYDVQPEDCLRDLRKQERWLSDFARHEEVVLWFEHDLFCQLHLVYLLQWFAGQQLGRTRLSLVCIDNFPGVDDFRGLGQLNPRQMASLFEARGEVSAAQLELAVAAWQAYCSPSPQDLQAIIERESAALPFLNSALRAHLARFPSTRNGLGCVENLALELINEGHREFPGLFQQFGHRASVYGFGDFQFRNELQRLAAAHTPLLSATNGDADGGLSISAYLKDAFDLTGEGALVLEGKADFVELNGIDLWLGGVHLKGSESAWRWDEESESLISNQAA